MAATALSHAYPLGTRVNERGHLEVGGCDVVELAERYGTPAYIYAEDDMRARARAYMEAFAVPHRRLRGDLRVQGAADHGRLPGDGARRACRSTSPPAASSTSRCAAGVDPERIFMHGNNKTEAELRLAFDAGIGYLVLDSFEEIELAERLLDRPAGRPDPGHARASSPPRTATSRPGSSTRSSASGSRTACAAEAVRRVRASERLDLVGIHAHIGSQIFELEPYAKTIQLLADFIDFDCRLLNVGGGLGIAYTAEDEPASIEDYVDVKVRGVQQAFDPVPRILIEPGRSLVGNAGITAYRIGTIKEIPGVRTYVAVDGGMSDNLRPMLYGARYEAAIADRPDAPATHARDDRRHALRVGRHPDQGGRAAGAAGRRRARDARDRRVRLRDGEQLQRRAAAAGDLLQGRRGARRRAPRDLRGPRGARRMTAAPFRVGLLGHGTVGSAFDSLLAERADAIAAATGRRPEIARRADALARVASTRSSSPPTRSSS